MIESYAVEVVVVKYVHEEHVDGHREYVRREYVGDLEIVGAFKTLAKAEDLLKNIYNLANATEIWFGEQSQEGKEE
tara:strand:+ start:771 stop:998 length:228 start_codon:yes stop_codon:yes gene_type:complete